MVRAHGRRLGADHDHSGPGEGGASLSPEKADITNETLIVAVGDGSGASSKAAGEWADASLSTVKDEKSELSGGNTFTPDETGFYRITFKRRINPGGSGDKFESRLRNITDSETVTISPRVTRSSGTVEGIPMLSEIVHLTSNKEYRPQSVDLDSSSFHENGETNSGFTVRSMFR